LKFEKRNNAKDERRNTGKRRSLGCARDDRKSNREDQRQKSRLETGATMSGKTRGNADPSAALPSKLRAGGMTEKATARATAKKQRQESNGKRAGWKPFEAQDKPARR
jgi:hypothetical protein